MNDDSIYDDITGSAFAANAPTAAQTSNSLASAGEGIERLLGLGLGAYSAINTAKNTRQANDIALAAANRTAPIPNANPSGFSMSTQVLMIAGGVALVGVLFFALRK